MFELSPMAFLVEQAGGAASNGHKRILELEPEEIHSRAPVFIGCKEDVALAEKFIAELETEAAAPTGKKTAKKSVTA